MILLMLDTGVLGYLCHPRRYLDVRAWYAGLETRHAPSFAVLVPEIADYELRPGLLAQTNPASVASLAHLDRLAEGETFCPIDSPTMRRAAELWAHLRREGAAIAGETALGADVILAAQAERYGATVVTDNVRHLARLVPTVRWQDV